MDGISGKRALVTGGGSGIGLGIALKLVELGATVFIIGRNKEKLDKAVVDSGSKLIPLQGDVAKWSAIREVVKEILPIQLLVNNAGIAIPKSVLEASEEDYEDIMSVNLKGAINLTQFICQDLISRDVGGNVVNVSSQISSRALQDGLMYCVSKAGLDMATKSFAFELGAKKIRVNSVNPTVVLTELGRQSWSDPVKVESMMSRIPQRKFSEVHQVVNATIFLLSDNSDMITGHCLAVDGGFLTA